MILNKIHKPAERKHLLDIISAVTICSKDYFSLKDAELIEVAVEEVAVNIMDYSESPDLTIIVSLENSDFIIQFEDSGKPFDPTSHHRKSEALSVGGYGVRLTRKIMNSVEYKHADGKNILRMKKNVSFH